VIKIAGGISVKRKGGHIGIVINDDEDSPSNRKVSYCPHCLEYGFKEALGLKILRNNEPRASA
jgi:hypothetical protein